MFAVLFAANACATNPSSRTKAASARRAVSDLVGCLDTLHASDSSATMPQAGLDARYPVNARLAGIDDSVMLAFTVRSDGIAAESIDLVSANYREFVASVFNALVKARYHPAHLGDCAVATRMKQRFVFRAPQ